MIELGGNIKLKGFNNVDPATLIVVKKIVGNYAKKIHEEAFPFTELALHLSEQQPIMVQASLAGKKSCSAEASDTNLFFALNKTLAQLMNEAQKP